MHHGRPALLFDNGKIKVMNHSLEMKMDSFVDVDELYRKGRALNHIGYDISIVPEPGDKEPGYNLDRFIMGRHKFSKYPATVNVDIPAADLECRYMYTPDMNDCLKSWHDVHKRMAAWKPAKVAPVVDMTQNLPPTRAKVRMATMRQIYYLVFLVGANYTKYIQKWALTTTRASHLISAAVALRRAA